jgi:hypothetical protein
MIRFPNGKTDTASKAQSSQIVRNWRALSCLAAIALAALAFWQPIRHYVLTAGVLRSDAPSESALTEAVEGASDPTQILQRIWQAGSLSGRGFVISYLQRNQKPDGLLFRRMQPVLEQAAWDADLDTREAAFSLLAQRRDSSLRQWLRQQLGDADPAVRALAVQHLSRIANSNDVPAVIRLLDDPDPRVVAVAGTLLKRATGQDFGLKTTMALPKFAWPPSTPPPPVDWVGLNRGRDAWREWWAKHKAFFSSEEHPSQSAPQFIARPTPNFALEDFDGQRVRLSDFRGKVVLVSFWNLTNDLSTVDEPAFHALLQNRGSDLAVLSIAIDPAMWPEESCGDHGGGHGDAHGDGHDTAQSHCHKARMDLAGTRAAARALAEHSGVRHPVLVDTTAALAIRYAINDLPAYVLLDAQGNLRRRVAGSRTEATFRAMVDEVAPRVSLPTSGRN